MAAGRGGDRRNEILGVDQYVPLRLSKRSPRHVSLAVVSADENGEF